VFFGALRRWPILAVTTIIPYFGLVIISVLDSVFAQKEIKVKTS
jgi:hypothetical protein